MNAQAAEKEASAVGFPLLLKASAGGGGRGMRVVRRAAEFAAEFRQASGEAEAAFGDGRVYLERFFEKVRHIEVQVFADAHGNVVHLGERDCSTQRRHQKLVEEAPSPALPQATRVALQAAAVRLTKGIAYQNAGTVEFVVDRASGDFYFIEMNTRIQVEHPVTEAVLGLDLVAEQLAVAAGERLSFVDKERTVAGHAIEWRINAEDPARGFLPTPGTITQWEPPSGDGLRLDTFVVPGMTLTPYYDSLLAKLIVTGRDRAEALSRSRNALAEFHVTGVSTTIPFHLQLIQHPDFLHNRVYTQWVEREFMPSQ